MKLHHVNIRKYYTHNDIFIYICAYVCVCLY